MANEQFTAGQAPDAQAAGSAAEFVAQMRALRQWSGLTIRQVSKKAQEAGDVLPHSTLNTALGRATLPREELVAAFVRACGGDQSTVNGWITVRKRLAAATAGQPEAVATIETAGKAAANSSTDEPRVRPPWGLLDAVPPLPAELAQVPGWERDGLKPLEAATGDEPDLSGAETVTVEAADVKSTGDEPVAAETPPIGEPCQHAGEPDSSTASERAESTLTPGRDLAETRPEPAAGESVLAVDRPVRLHAYSEGTLATVVKNRRNRTWSGQHRKRTTAADGEAVEPLRLRDFAPPLAFRAGWSARVLLGILVVVFVLVAVGVAVRTLREFDSGNGPADARADSTVDYDVEGPLPSEDVGGQTSSPSPSPSSRPTSAALAPTSTAPSSPKVSPTRAVTALPVPGKYRMMPAATANKSYCVGVGPEPGNNRREVAVLVPCAEAKPATSELRKVAASTYQIYWANPSGGGGCLQVDPNPNGEPSTADGMLLAPHGYCNRPDQRFILEPVQTNAGQGYRLHAETAPKTCIGPIGGGRNAGTAVAQVSCLNDNVQVFLFEP
ncbi:helix-turn-helix domain-containing protein [Dactylosporangium sp. NPDC000555]|uniref:helix-turn-helix domain-containing protein n=1 Tax=Dactylosporangium sp. NPDC000555 TaxID=3154260 RepID=UPI0033166617